TNEGLSPRNAFPEKIGIAADSLIEVTSEPKKYRFYFNISRDEIDKIILKFDNSFVINEKIAVPSLKYQRVSRYIYSPLLLTFY
ncbi:MAG: hypothetical protein QG635_1001, partial [Bacteroidota bacterium]|nr:hypothetical protein [Bacteroidota bacterium]